MPTKPKHLQSLIKKIMRQAIGLNIGQREHENFVEVSLREDARSFKRTPIIISYKCNQYSCEWRIN